MPNILTFIMLGAWPVFAVLLYLALAKSPARAVIWVTLIGFLILPSKVGINLPGVPALDKAAIGGIALGLITLMFRPKSDAPRSFGVVALLCFAMLLLGPLGTSFTNSDRVFTATNSFQGIALYDAASMSMRTLLTVVLPFLAGFYFFQKAEDLREILLALVWTGLGYSLLMLVEVRLSPQIHVWIYGYFPHSFAQQIRDGGYRPVVFLQHGLWVAFFAMTVTIAAVALWRQSQKDVGLTSFLKPYFLPISGYFWLVLVLCKSLSSLLYSIVLYPIVALISTRKQCYFAAILAVISLSYPLSRGLDLLPLEEIASFAAAIDPERAASLEFRLANDEALLGRASERVIFGWGGWGRGLIYDEFSGKRISTVDGYWVATLGSRGVVGFLGVFALLAWPVLRLAKQVSSGLLQPTPVLAALCLILGINMIELLPNSTFPPFALIICGALLSFANQTKTVAIPNEPPLPQRRRTVM